MTLEVEEDSLGRLWGMMYLRGFEKNTLIGCDYLVVGMHNGRLVNMAWQKVVRQVNLNDETCGWLRNMSGFYSATEIGINALSGVWKSQNGLSSPFSVLQSDTVVSTSTREELDKYAEEMFAYFESNGLYLAPDQRRNDSAARILTDSAEVVLEIRSASRQTGDSISIYRDGEVAIFRHDVFQNPLRLRIPMTDSLPSEILFVNESPKRNKVRLRINWIEEGLPRSMELIPTHTRNQLFVLTPRRRNS